jgi:hypothetical protein
MVEPSIRGSIFRGVVEDVLRQCEAGVIEPGVLEATLEPSDLEILHGKVLDGLWYPTTTYTRLLELLCLTVGGGRRIFYAERGAANAQRLMDHGLYAQLDLLERLPDEVRAAAESERLDRMAVAFREKLALIVSLASTIYNVGSWSVAPDPDTPAHRLCIEILEAEAYSDPMRLAIEGFLNQCARSVPGRETVPRLFRSERLDDDHIRVRMTLDLRELMEKV